MRTTCRLLLLNAVMVIAGPALSADKPNALHPSAALSLRTSDSRIEMENRTIRLEIHKSSGAILAIFYEGSNLVGGGKGYMQSNDENGFLSPKQTNLIIASNDDEVLDIGFAHRHDFAVDYEFHYVLRPDEPGFYNYIVYGSKSDNPGEHRLAQLNYALRLDPAIFTHFADGHTTGALPTPSLLRAGKEVMDATYELPDGTAYTKYNHAAVMDEVHRVHGLMGSSDGAWVIMPSHEHLNGVPFNTELTLHQTSSTPVLLRHVQAAHHGSGVAEFSTTDGPWEKWGGPWFFYFNRGGSMEVREQEAQALAKRMAADWPFQWIKDERFATQRGTLRGQLTDQNGNSIAHARVVITQAARGLRSLLMTARAASGKRISADSAGSDGKCPDDHTSPARSHATQRVNARTLFLSRALSVQVDPSLKHLSRLATRKGDGSGNNKHPNPSPSIQ